jgi:hypothetical protein
MKSDYERLGLSEDKNIYHYVTRDESRFVINECAYPLIDLNNLKKFNLTPTAFFGRMVTKITNIHLATHKFIKNLIRQKKILLLHQFDIKIIEDPFSFLLEAYFNFIDKAKVAVNNIVEVYLPLYSYQSKEVEEKSGLNAWNQRLKTQNIQIN